MAPDATAGSNASRRLTRATPSSLHLRITRYSTARKPAMNTTALSASSDQDDLERLARKRVRAKMGWLIHAFIFVTVNCLLIALSLSAGRHWFVWPLLGWGLGLILHGAKVWLAAPGGKLYSRMLEKERRSLRQQGNAW